jgi:hypothetical protein
VPTAIRFASSFTSTRAIPCQGNGPRPEASHAGAEGMPSDDRAIPTPGAKVCGDAVSAAVQGDPAEPKIIPTRTIATTTVQKHVPCMGQPPVPRLRSRPSAFRQALQPRSAPTCNSIAWRSPTGNRRNAGPACRGVALWTWSPYKIRMNGPLGRHRRWMSIGSNEHPNLGR